MERKHEYKFNLHDVEKKELEKFLADNPHFHSRIQELIKTLKEIGVEVVEK